MTDSSSEYWEIKITCGDEMTGNEIDGGLEFKVDFP